MAKQDKKKAAKIKVKKKLWYKVMAPKTFGQKHLGDSYLTAPETAVSRTLKANLRELTGSVRDQNAYVHFQIAKVDGTSLQTTSIGFELIPAFIKRIVRKNADRIDVHCTVTSKDGKKAIVKSVLLTVYKTYRSTRTELQHAFIELLQQEAAKVDFETFISMLTAYKVQGPIKKKLAKIFPLKEAAVRSVKMQKVKGKAMVVEEHPEAHEKPDQEETQQE